MDNSNKEHTNWSTLSLLQFIYLRRKHLLVITIIAFVFSVIASFILRPQYKAVATLFAVRSFSVSKYLTDGPEALNEDYMDIGDEDDIEKLMQILNSTELQDLVVKRFNLYSHWNIDADDPNKETWMHLKFQDMVNFKRTDLKSVKIEVFDYSPDTAAKMANAIAVFADTVKNRYTRRIAVEALNILKDEYNRTLTYMKMLEDSMQTIRDKGVLEYNLQVQALTRSLGKALAEGRDASKIEEKLKTFEKYGGPYFNLTNEVLLQKERQVYLKGKLDAAYLNATRSMPSNMQVEKAKKPDKKAKPVRWAIVLLSMLSAFVAALIVLILIDKFGQFKKKIKEIS